MNICILTPRYYPNSPGGGARSCHLIARELQKHVNVEVVSLDGDKEQSSEIDDVPVQRLKPVSSEKTRVNLQAYNYMKKRLGKYDLIHTYNMDLMLALGLLTRRHGVNSLATLNGTIYTRYNEWYHRFKETPADLRNTIFSISLLARNYVHKKFVKSIRKFTALCPYRKEMFVNEGIPEEKISVITILLDTSRELPPRETKDRKVRILYFGTSRWRKGLDILIEAYSFLEKRDVEIKIAGLSDVDSMRTTIEKMGMLNEVNVQGYVPYDDIGGLFSASDILVFPLRYPEPVGRVLIEGMQSSLCVIATGTECYSPIIRDMQDGILFHPSTPENLVEKIRLVLDDPKLCELLGRNAMDRVYDVCNPQKIGREYIELYENMLG